MEYYPRFRGAILLFGVDSYALLTRLPLGCTVWYVPARLAYLKHAASVHPEPGSNSQKKGFLPLSDCQGAKAKLELRRP